MPAWLSDAAFMTSPVRVKAEIELFNFVRLRPVAVFPGAVVDDQFVVEAGIGERVLYGRPGSRFTTASPSLQTIRFNGQCCHPHRLIF